MANLEPILAVAAKLAAPFDVDTMLSEVVEAAKQVLRAERGSVWLYARESVGSSRVDLQACKLEYSIVSPK